MEHTERDTMLLDTIIDVVPHADGMHQLTEIIGRVAPGKDGDLIVAMLKGYGNLLNILQAASELGELMPDDDMYARLCVAYYELTNTAGDPDEEIRLRDEPNED